MNKINVDEFVGLRKGTRIQATGRKCQYPGCAAILSIYTRGHYCNAHERTAMEDADPRECNLPTPRYIIKKWQKLIKRGFLERMMSTGKTEEQIARIIGAPSPCIIRYFVQKYHCTPPTQGVDTN